MKNHRFRLTHGDIGGIFFVGVSEQNRSETVVRHNGHNWLLQGDAHEIQDAVLKLLTASAEDIGPVGYIGHTFSRRREPKA